MAEKDLQVKRAEFITKAKNFFSTDGASTDEFSQKRKKVISYVKDNKHLLVFLLLFFIIWLGVSIRVANFPLLKDVTTGEPVSVDLDSHIYFKYAQQILEQGSLPAVDYDRFVPLGAPTANYAFPAYSIYYLYQTLHFFDPTVTLAFADILYPVVAFAIGIIFFFLLTRRVFKTPTALLASLFLAFMPAFLQRTMGGSSDHDALGMMFMFISLYLFLVAWQAATMKKSLLWGGLAGIATGLTGLSWGAWKILALIFGVFTLLQYFFQKVDEKRLALYALWLFVALFVMTAWVPLFSLKAVVTSLTTIIPFFVLVVLLVDLVLFKRDWLKLKAKLPQRVPPVLASFLISLILGVLALLVVIGPMNLGSQLSEAKSLLLHPMGKDRWELTVAEQRQPYFREVLYSFGPNFLGVPAFYFLFIVGTIFAFYAMIKDNKDRIRITLAYTAFLLLLMLTRYSPESLFNGTNRLSVTLYFGSFLVFVGLTIYYIWKIAVKDKERYRQLGEWDNGILLLLIWTMLMVIATRGAVRLIFIFAPVAALFASYAVIEICKIALAMKNKMSKVAVLLIVLLVVASPLAAPFQGIIPDNYDQAKKQGMYFGPPYNHPWQQAGGWVRENVPKDAVFGHWWDYGYWVQNGFKRASVLDGANKVKYWNYLMGRHVLTGQTQKEALEFLSVHNTTHFLIVADEIGKYTAYSSIGSDENYDRYSWITTFVINPQGTQETRNMTVFMFQGSYALDDDFVWEGKVFPRHQSGVGAVFVPVTQVSGDKTGGQFLFGQPTIALVKDGQRTDVPLQCLYVNGEMFRFANQGYAGCFRMMPVLDDRGDLSHPFGAGLFVSEEGVKALWTNLYLFEQKNPGYDTSAFELIYGENEAKVPLAVFRGQLIGPIKIWKINYPADFVVDEETEKRYLGGNEYLPDYFFTVNEGK